MWGKKAANPEKIHSAADQGARIETNVAITHQKSWKVGKVADG